jgi:hypothetical protein
MLLDHVSNARNLDSSDDEGRMRLNWWLEVRPWLGSKSSFIAASVSLGDAEYGATARYIISLRRKNGRKTHQQGRACCSAQGKSHSKRRIRLIGEGVQLFTVQRLSSTRGSRMA